MSLLSWFREWAEIRDRCKSCEILQHQLEASNYERQLLMDRLFNKEPEKEIVEQQKFQPIPPKNIPWNVRRQMLEREDREKARIMKQAPVPIPIEDLEAEMGLAEKSRENEMV